MPKQRNRVKRQNLGVFLVPVPLLLGHVMAQTVDESPLPSAGRADSLSPVGSPSGVPLNELDPNPSATSVFSGAAPAGLPNTLLENPFRIGPVELRPHLDYTFTYGDGVSTAPGTQRRTALHSISPGLLLQAARVTLDYTPSLNYYSHEAFEDTVEHAAWLAGQYDIGDWSFRLRQTYSKTSSPLIETGAQTEQESHVTSLSARYQHNEKISFDLGFDQRFQSAQELTSSREWSTTDWINYHLTDDTTVGLGAAFGYVDVSRGSDMTYEHALARVTSRFSEKLSTELSGGAEFRQFIDGSSPDQVNPILSARASYFPWIPTALIFSVNRTVETSLYEGFVTQNLHFQAILNQRLLGRFYLDLNAGYRMSEMEVGTLQDQVGRSDDLTTVSAALRASVLTRGSASVFYRHSTNESTAELYSFSSDQFGFQVGYRF